jgi:peroxin-19
VQKLASQFESLSQNTEFQGMMEGVLKQLLSKDVLYEPMKEIQKLVCWLFPPLF